MDKVIFRHYHQKRQPRLPRERKRAYGSYDRRGQRAVVYRRYAGIGGEKQMSLLFAGIEKNQRFFVVSFGPSYNGSTQGWGSCSGSPILPGPKLTIAIPRVVRVRFQQPQVLWRLFWKKFK